MTMPMHLYSLVLILLAIFLVVKTEKLQIVEDIEVYHWTKRERHLVVLFANKNCTKSDIIEKELIGIENDLKKKLKGVIIKTVNNSLAPYYSASLEVVPLLILFRRSVPLWYNGTIEGKRILQYFMENIESTVTVLTDSNFENTTQAQTGAAGGWLVFFHSASCAVSGTSRSLWQAVGAALRNRTKVGRLETTEEGAAIERSLKLGTYLQVILFQRGLMYKYNGNKFNIQEIINFAKKGYKKVVPKSVIQTQKLNNEPGLEWVPKEEDTHHSKSRDKRYALTFQIFLVALSIVLLIAYIIHISTTSEGNEQKSYKAIMKEMKQL